MKTLVSAITLCLISFVSASAQSPAGASWKRQSDAVQPELRLFHSTQVVALPTAEMLNSGVSQFEIAHRFWPTFADGSEELYGLDGPVNMRIGLGFAPVDLVMITLARSNVNDNVDLQAKAQLLRHRSDLLPILVAIQAGGSWNSAKREGRDRTDSRNFQLYLQGIINTLIRQRLALGLVPSYLRNSDINSPETEDLTVLGIYAQVYVNRLLSVMAEWAPELSGEAGPYAPAAFGIELETGGHFFKIIATNSLYLNPSQYLFGAEDPIKADKLRLGFVITRLLWI